DQLELSRKIVLCEMRSRRLRARGPRWIAPSPRSGLGPVMRHGRSLFLFRTPYARQACRRARRRVSSAVHSDAGSCEQTARLIPAGRHKRSAGGNPGSDRRTCEPKESAGRRRLPRGGRPGVVGIGYALYPTANRRTDRSTSAALFSRLTELHWNKKRFF